MVIIVDVQNIQISQAEFQIVFYKNQNPKRNLNKTVLFYLHDHFEISLERNPVPTGSA